MTCEACLAYHADERAAIERDELPVHALGACTCADEPTLDILLLPGWRLFPSGDLSEYREKHVGIQLRQTWDEHLMYLARSVAGDRVRWPDPDVAKRQEGGWAGCLCRDAWRDGDAFESASTMTVDVDAHGEVDRAAEAFAGFRKAIHATYKSTPEAPRCRVVLPLARPCTDLGLYKRGHKYLCELLFAWGYVRKDRERRIKGDIDEGASDATRLNYAPMHHPDRRPEFLATDGALLDLDRIPVAAKPTRPVLVRAPVVSHGDRDRAYRQGALARASATMAAALEGERHGVLFAETASLARPELDLDFGEIREAMISAWVVAAGEGRLYEGERTLRDAFERGRQGT